MLIFRKATSCVSLLQSISQPLKQTSIRSYAARKGTRERKQKNKVKVEEVKTSFIERQMKDKNKIVLRQTKKFDDSWKSSPLDNVYIRKYHKWPVFTFSEAISCLRETHHPDMYNRPNAKVTISFELNMEMEKKNKFIDNFTRIVAIPHTFDHGEDRSIAAFVKDPELQLLAKDAGAHLSGGTELIKEFQTGGLSLQNFQFVIAHPNILPELVALRGLMKKKFPNPKFGTLDSNFVEAVKKFSTGIKYSAVGNEHEKDFGLIETSIGMLGMDVQQLEENFSFLVQDVYSGKSSTFVRRCLISTDGTDEKFKVNSEIYVNANETDSYEIEERAVN